MKLVAFIEGTYLSTDMLGIVMDLVKDEVSFPLDKIATGIDLLGINVAI